MGLFTLIPSGLQVTMPGPLPASVAPAGQHANLDVKLLEGLVQSLYAKGIADSTRSAHSTSQRRYLTFCSNFGISPLPLCEYSLFVLLPSTSPIRDYRPAQSPPTYLAFAISKSPPACKRLHSLTLSNPLA